jgi:hypothetical protein
MEAAAVKTSTAVEPAATVTSAMTAAAVDLRDQRVRNMRARWRAACTDRRHRVGTLNGGRRQHEYRRSRQATAADNSAPGIFNLRHCETSL